MAEIIDYQVDGRIATITLNRPDRRNALNEALVEALANSLKRAERDAQVRCIVITGAGSSFSAGADLDEMHALQDASPMQNRHDSHRLADLFLQIHSLPKPVIARVNGPAIAGGCGLAAVCDIAVADRSAKFGFPEVRIGFVPAIVSVFVLRKVGEADARDLLLRGRIISAEEAVRMGLITYAVESSQLDSETQDIASEILTEVSASALALTKQLLSSVRGMGLLEALDYAVQLNAFARGTADCRAGVEAFLNKSDPPWRKDA